MISFPLIDSPTSPDPKHHHHNHDQPFESFNSIQNPFSAFHGSSALLRDAFDYYRLPNNNPTPISDALNMSLHGSAFKAQLHSIHDISSALSFQHQHQPCIPTAQLFSPAANTPTNVAASSSQVAASPSPISPLLLPLTSSSSSTIDDQCSGSRSSHMFTESVGQIVIPPSTTASNSSSSPISQSQQSPKKRPPRATVSTKDFVPPDVTGLSKREARLVKNRAAAFLSRQRKREEFECMELRVAQLEQENARLLSMTQQYSSSSSSRSPSPVQPSSKHPKINSAEPSDSDNLRGLLAESRARAAELEKELERLRSNATSSSPCPSSESGSEVGSPARGAIQIKRETAPPELIPRRTSASLFGVVLLCALPSLLSLPAPIMPHAASRFSFTPGPGSVNHQPHGAESLLDWPGMDIDDDASGSRRKVNLPLSFLNSQNDLLQQNFMNGGGPDLSLLPPIPPDFEAGSEAEFDVSFMASPNEGKIRVRIERPSSPPSSSSSSSSSAPVPISSSSGSGSATSGRICPMTGSSPISPTLDSPSFVHSSPSDGWDLDFSAPDHAAQGLMWDSPSAGAAPGANVDLAIFASDVSASSSSSTSSRRRVRIALKSGPVAGAEGGEWEVEVC